MRYGTRHRPAGNEFGSSAAAKIAIEIGVPIFLIRGDLIRRPGFRDANQVPSSAPKRCVSAHIAALLAQTAGASRQERSERT
jgi:hypothetical protein